MYMENMPTNLYEGLRRIGAGQMKDSEKLQFMNILRVRLVSLSSVFYLRDRPAPALLVTVKNILVSRSHGHYLSFDVESQGSTSKYTFFCFEEDDKVEYVCTQSKHFSCPAKLADLISAAR